MKEQGIMNSKVGDSSSKIIFEDAQLCSQFLRGYVNIPVLKDVQPEDIEDVTERYVHMFVEERNADVVKKVHLRQENIPFYMVSLIEHKTQVDYNVVMQILRYIIYIWEDYEKEQEKLHPGIRKTKGFRYPPVLPIIYYEGAEEWTAAQELKERVFLSDVLTEYIPNFKCVLVKLRDYSNAELMEHEDELSVVMMINKLQKAADFKQLGSEIGPEYLKSVTAQSPEYLLNIISMVIRILLLKIKVPDEEVEAFVEQVKERRMGELFANFEEYDVQETRRLAREEARQELRGELLQLVREEVRQKTRQELREEMLQLVREEVQQKTRQELREEMLQLVREEVQQKTRQELREEMLQLVREEVQQEEIIKYICVVKELTNSKEAAVEQLVKQYGLSEADAKEKVESNW